MGVKNLLLGIFAIILFVLTVSTVIYHRNTTALIQPQLPQLHQPETKNDLEQPLIEELRPIDQEQISYSLQNGELNMTFNQGLDWVEVPVFRDDLFTGEYRGNKQELIENSYILSEDLAAFLYSDGMDWEDERILLLYTTDQGKTWENTIIADPFIGLRFRKIEFLDEAFGYVILSGDRTMSQEFSQVYVTNDGGKSWQPTNNSDVTRLIADGGFVDEMTGFLSYGTINPDTPDLYVTQDGGKSWDQAIIHIPAKYERVFVMAETPVKEGDHLEVLINQGPNGDYAGGLVKGKFISMDNGTTWEFTSEVQPDEVE